MEPVTVVFSSEKEVIIARERGKIKVWWAKSGDNYSLVANVYGQLTAIVPTQVEYNIEVINPQTIFSQVKYFDKAQFAHLLSFLDEYYYNNAALVSDKVYEELATLYSTKWGQWKPEKATFSEPTGEKAPLPFYLGSLRKLKTEAELRLWSKNYPGPYLVEDKVDGITLLLTVRNGKRRLYTKGQDGVYGTDVSHLLDVVNFPNIKEDISVRGELVMTIENFKWWAENSKEENRSFKNPRNTVSGAVGAKKSFNPQLVKLFSFWAYQIMENTLTPIDQTNKLIALGFNTPFPFVLESLNVKDLENKYIERKASAPYEMDGLVIYQNQIKPFPTTGEPKHVIAFKSEQLMETMVTKVTGVTWKTSKNYLLKPTILYETVRLSGADLKKATGYNAKFIVEKNIGPGAIVKLIRSGDVIPKIIEVISGASSPALPDPNVHGSYHWNETGVELVADIDNNDVIESKLKHFTDTLGIKNMGPSRIKALVRADIRTVQDLLEASEEDFAMIDGIGPTLSHQFWTDIHNNVNGIRLAKALDASGLFPNVGEKRFNIVLESFPDLLEWADRDPAEISAKIQKIKGFAEKISNKIAESMSSFKEWLEDHPQIRISKVPLSPSSLLSPSSPLTPISPSVVSMVSVASPSIGQQSQQAPSPQFNQIPRNLVGKTIVFSGFRDKPMEDQIISRGGKVTTSVSKNTNFMVMKNTNDVKGKAEKAISLGIPLIQKDDFIRQYLS